MSVEDKTHLDPVDRLKQLERRGAYFEAADLASRLLEDFDPEHLRDLEDEATVGKGASEADVADAAEAATMLDELYTVSFLHVLVVARSGALENATELYKKYSIAERANEDAQSLGARLIKDQAFEASGEARTNLLREAADAYAAVYNRFGGSFPAVNAATLNLLAGEEEKATEYAARTLEACTTETPAAKIIAFVSDH